MREGLRTATQARDQTSETELDSWSGAQRPSGHEAVESLVSAASMNEHKKNPPT